MKLAKQRCLSETLHQLDRLLLALATDLAVSGLGVQGLGFKGLGFKGLGLFRSWRLGSRALALNPMKGEPWLRVFGGSRVLGSRVEGA